MATVVRVVSRSALSYSRRPPTRRKSQWTSSFSRHFSSNPQRRADNADLSARSRPLAAAPLPEFISEDSRSEWEALTPEQRAEDEATFAQIKKASSVRTHLDVSEQPAFDALSPQQQARQQTEFDQKLEEWSQKFDAERAMQEADALTEKMDRDEERNNPLAFPDTKPTNPGFWALDEDDEFGQVEDDDDEFKNDDMTSVAHAHLELHREMRHYARIAAWDMPFLSKLAKPFEPPPLSQPLRFRYTTYMGESHPAGRKVVATLCTKDLMTSETAALTEQERVKLVKLAGIRYNPSTDILKISSEKFESAAQNKRYIGDLVQGLIREAKDTSDTFEDIPLDFRHHRPVQKPAFPVGWSLTKERRAQLVADREDRKAKEIERQEQRLLIDGQGVVGQHVEILIERGSASAIADRSRPMPSTFGSRAGGGGVAKQRR